jgi:hypothetical protein
MKPPTSSYSNDDLNYEVQYAPNRPPTAQSVPKKSVAPGRRILGGYARSDSLPSINQVPETPPNYSFGKSQDRFNSANSRRRTSDVQNGKKPTLGMFHHNP